jgi:hypothetical protein
MKAALFLTGLAIGAWLGNAWARSAPTESSEPDGDSWLRVAQQPGPGRVTHFRAAC